MPPAEASADRLCRLAILLLLAVGGLGVARVLGGCIELDGTFFRLAALDQPARWQTLAGLAAAGGLLALLRRRDPRLTLRVLLPLAALLPMQFLPLSLVSIVVTVAAVGWCAARAAAAGMLPMPRALLRRDRAMARGCAGAVLLLAAGWAIHSFFVSRLAFDRLALASTDWMTYVEICRNTWNGAWLRGLYPEPNFSAGHFMPGFFLLFAPLFGLLPQVNTAFALNAVLLALPAPLLFRLGRRIGLAPFYAAAGGVLYLLFPGVSNLTLCLFYGFNAIYLFLPCFVLFTLLHESGRRRTALAVFAFTLLIKETLGIFWLGWGLMAIHSGRDRRTGVLTAAIGAVWFFAAILWFIPGGGHGDYIFYGQYAHLGSSMWEILGSPILRPAAFWGSLFSAKNLLFLLLMLLPVMPAALNRPWLLGASCGVIGFHLIRNSADVVNITQHYQAELLITAVTAAVLGLGACRPGSRSARLIAGGLIHAGRGARLRWSFAVGTLICAAGAHYFFAQSFYGVHSLRQLTAAPDCRAVFTAANALIPPGAALEADENLASHYLFRNPVTRFGAAGTPPADYRFYQLGSMLSPDGERHRAALTDPDFGLIGYWRVGAKQFYLYRRGAAALPPPAAEFRSDADGLAGGEPIEVLDAPDRYELRGRVETNAAGRPVFRAFARFHRPPAQFVEVRIWLLGAEGEARELIIIPGEARRLPETLRPEEIFTGELELPPGWPPVNAVGRLTGINAPAAAPALPPGVTVR